MNRKNIIKKILICGTASVMALSLGACNKNTDSVVTTGTSEISSGAEDEGEAVSNTEPTPTEPTQTGQVQTEPVETEPFVHTIYGVYEAEEGVFTGGVKSENTKPDFSGNGYATGFANDNDSCAVEINIESEGFYDLVFTSASSGGYKENYVFVDGESIGNLVTEDSKFTDCSVNRVFLTAGKHEIKISKYWGWIMLDKITVVDSEPIDASFYEVSKKLVNPNASDNTKRLMSYLVDNYGNHVISGQYCDTGRMGKEFAVINKVTGKYPAILGLDFIEYSPSRVENGSSSKAVEYAIDHYNKGGIVTFCWHWNAPSKYLTGLWYKGFYADSTNINLKKIMNGEDKEGYDLLMSDIDAIAKELQRLEDADVPILWRPLHEASGGWFWWGASGAEAYKQLYILLYDKLTNEYGLDNLIWVWNGQDKEWYPGDEYVDIIGEDIYAGEKVYTSQVNKFLEVAGYGDSKKMVILSENGCVPDPELLERDGAMWGSFATWGTEFVATNTSIYAYSEQYTEKDMLKKVYYSELVISLDELPDLKTYPME